MPIPLRFLAFGLLILGGWAHVAAADETRFTSDLIIEPGVANDQLPQRSIRAMAETTDGRFWCATFGGIAVRGVDGWTTIDSMSDPALPTSRVTALTAIGNVVWGGTQEGHVFRFDRGHVQSWHVDPGKFIRRIDVRDTDVVVATENGLALIERPMDDGTLTWIDRGRDVLSVCRGPDDWIWFAAQRRSDGVTSVSRWKGGVLEEIEAPVGQVWGHPCILHDARLGMWVADRSGVMHIEDASVAWFQSYPNGFNSRVHDLVPDQRRGFVVVCRAGVFRCEVRNGGGENDLTIRTINVDADDLFAGIVDRRGVVWLGTDQDGLIRCRPALARRPTMPDRVKGRPAWALALDGDGELWFSAQISDTTESAENFPRIIGEPQCRSLTADKDGKILGASPDQLVRFEKDGPVTLATTNERINTVVMDASNVCWYGTVSGLWTLTDDGPVRVDLPNESSVEVRVLQRAPDDSLLVATDRYVHRFDGAHWDSVELPRVMTPFPIRALVPDRDDVLYAITYGAGVMVIRDGHVRHLTREDGLDENFLTAMLIDEERNTAWLMGNRGGYRMSLTEWRQFVDGTRGMPRSFRFDEREGVSEGNAGMPAGLLLDDGSAVFSTITGPVVLPARHMYSGRLTPPRVLSIEVDGAEADIDGGTAQLPAGARRVRLRFTGGVPERPSDVHYGCRIEGLDDDWIPIGPDREVMYTNLAPGTYEIAVRAAVGDGRWIESVGALTLTKAAAWHERSAIRAMLVAVIVVLSVVTLIMIRRQHRRRLQNLQRELEMQRHMQERESLFTAELNHRVRNNLGAILSLIRLSLPEESPNVRSLKSRVHAMSTAHRLLSERNWNATPLQEIVKSVVHVQPSGPDALQISGIDPMIRPDVCQPIALVLHELAHNALRHGAWKDGAGTVAVTCAEEGENLVIHWSEASARNVDASDVVEGTGLTLVRGLVGHELHGSIEFRSGTSGLEVVIAIRMNKCRADAGSATGNAA